MMKVPLVPLGCRCLILHAAERPLPPRRPSHSLKLQCASLFSCTLGLSCHCSKG